MSANASAAIHITPQILHDINMTDSIQKLNQTHAHNQMIEQQKVHTIPLPEDPRTLQLALELSLVGLNESNQNNSYTHPILAQGDYAFTRTDVGPMNNLPLPPTTASGLLMPSVGLEERSKKSQNMTECVPVPSSEHVAEIVGRQGKEPLYILIKVVFPRLH